MKKANLQKDCIKKTGNNFFTFYKMVTTFQSCAKHVICIISSNFYNYYYPHITKEETEVWSGQITWLIPHSK